MAITLWNDYYSFQWCIHHHLVGWSKLKGAQIIRRRHATTVISACTWVETMHFFMQLPLLIERNGLCVKNSMEIKQDSTARQSFCGKYTPRHTISSKQIKERKHSLSLSLKNRHWLWFFPLAGVWPVSLLCLTNFKTMEAKEMETRDKGWVT